MPFKGHGDFDRFDRILDAVAPEVAGIRRFGSAALDLAWVAAGRYDGFWEEELQFWDIAAGHRSWCARRAASSPISAAATPAWPTARCWPPTTSIHSRLHKLVAGALR